ncbi:MAG TPA: MetS family NSS transporter small subunit [Candidatus Copromorpha excrementigallinarum]|uniref:MetS family NSS transporter small subunit n=1 Tax=Candidatus Allocopromorpha excrementigallinarum TaxID=2840742 RepID=A0A9D1L742_9FIRM|nr:MetS family NSS transporter small subunit [Candidatus Copromorpha excrementigallinarum]
MNTSAVIMMIIGCTGLWGGFAVACFISHRHSKKQRSDNVK